MFLVFFGILLYFLPSIIGHNKQGAAGIFLLNFFLGWTIIGWVAALFWACTAAVRPQVYLAGVPSHYCPHCGALCGIAGRFCSACGRPA